MLNLFGLSNMNNTARTIFNGICGLFFIGLGLFYLLFVPFTRLIMAGLSDATSPTKFWVSVIIVFLCGFLFLAEYQCILEAKIKYLIRTALVKTILFGTLFIQGIFGQEIKFGLGISALLLFIYLSVALFRSNSTHLTK